MHLFGTHTSGEVTRPPFAGSVLVPAIFKYKHFVEEEFMFSKAGFEEDRLNPEIISSKIMSSHASYNHFIPILKRKCKRKNAKSLRLKKETNESFQCVSCEAVGDDTMKQHLVRPCNRNLRKTATRRAASNIQTQNKTQNPEGEIDMLDLNEVIRNELKPYNFCFEHVPANAPWFRVFTRQDESKEEIFEYYGNTVYRELPYEMGPLPPKQDTCKLCQPPPDQKVIVPKTEPIQMLKQPKVEPAETQENKVPSHGKVKKIANKALLGIEMRRKSPREHASTLAIMSCLLQETQNNFTDNCDIDVKEEDESERTVSKADHKLESKIDVDKSPVQQCEDTNVPLKNNAEAVKRQSSPCHKSDSGKSADKDSSVHSPKKKNSRLSEDLVSVKKLERDIDFHLLHSFEEWNLENSVNLASQSQKSVFTHDVPLDDRIFDNSRNNISNSNKVASRLKIFNFFSTGKKRKNKTGWPKKKRVASRQHFVKFTNRPNGFTNIHHIDNCERLEPTINENDCVPSIGIEAEEKYSSNAAFSNQDMNVVKNDFICKTDDSDLLAASSDSLDTVFDVGSQIKTEDQQKIIASSKYNTRNNSFVRSKQICVSKVKKRIKGKGKKKRFNRIKVEKFEAIQDNCKNSSIPNVLKRNEAEPVSPAASIISTRGLRKPRGCWYRER